MKNALRDLETLCFGANRQQIIVRWLERAGVPYSLQGADAGVANIVIGVGRNRIVGAHYDSIGPGALDNGAAVIALLHAARAGLAQNAAIVLFDAEELDHWKMAGSGSRVFGQELRLQGILPELFVVLDVIGYGNCLIAGDHPCCRRMLEVIRERSGQRIRVRPTPQSDHTWLHPCVNSVLLSALPYEEEHRPHPKFWDLLHGPSDSPSIVDTSEIERFTDLVCRLLQ